VAELRQLERNCAGAARCLLGRGRHCPSAMWHCYMCTGGVGGGVCWQCVCCDMMCEAPLLPHTVKTPSCAAGVESVDGFLRSIALVLQQRRSQDQRQPCCADDDNGSPEHRGKETSRLAAAAAAAARACVVVAALRGWPAVAALLLPSVAAGGRWAAWMAWALAGMGLQDGAAELLWAALHARFPSCSSSTWQSLFCSSAEDAVHAMDELCPPGSSLLHVAAAAGSAAVLQASWHSGQALAATQSSQLSSHHSASGRSCSRPLPRRFWQAGASRCTCPGTSQWRPGRRASPRCTWPPPPAALPWCRLFTVRRPGSCAAGAACVSWVVKRAQLKGREGSSLAMFLLLSLCFPPWTLSLADMNPAAARIGWHTACTTDGLTPAAFAAAGRALLALAAAEAAGDGIVGPSDGSSSGAEGGSSCTASTASLPSIHSLRHQDGDAPCPATDHGGSPCRPGAAAAVAMPQAAAATSGAKPPGSPVSVTASVPTTARSSSQSLASLHTLGASGTPWQAALAPPCSPSSKGAALPTVDPSPLMGPITPEDSPARAAGGSSGCSCSCEAQSAEPSAAFKSCVSVAGSCMPPGAEYMDDACSGTRSLPPDHETSSDHGTEAAGPCQCGVAAWLLRLVRGPQRTL
jgi:hypothetical protein